MQIDWLCLNFDCTVFSSLSRLSISSQSQECLQTKIMKKVNLIQLPQYRPSLCNKSGGINKLANFYQ